MGELSAREGEKPGASGCISDASINLGASDSETLRRGGRLKIKIEASGSKNSTSK